MNETSATVKVVSDLTRSQLVQYAGASGDYNPIHTDEIYATQALGEPSVFAHGMLTMALTGRALTDRFGTTALRRFGGRFTRQVWPGDMLSVTLTEYPYEVEGDTRSMRLAVTTRNQRDELVFDGYAQVTFEA